MTSGQQGPGNPAGEGAVRNGQQETCEETVARLQQELTVAQKKVQVVGSVTRHDILNQLTAIMGYNELLLTMIKEENVRNFLEIEQRASDKIRRIFAFSKVYQLMGTEPPRWQKLAALVRLACDEIDLKGIALSEEAGDLYLYGEPQLYKVFSYLFDNAIRHGKKTTRIRIILEHRKDDAILVVQDDGEGVPPENREKIFERGFGKYTGWGLFVAREILSLNGMAIRENGVEGKGARFEITIPQSRIKTGDKPPAR
ncbi:MAG TPA: HAMP domain-containing sensor histidine kinase [Methanoregulaceae archaeon]|nr:HAMP domain-containing sensor histidine kinase [Methanoregulaceae archaeon]